MESPDPEGPATRAARRAGPRVPRPRAYAQPPADSGTGDAVALAATRALLAVQTREEAAAVLRTAVNDLGGGVVPARLAGPDCVHVDVSLGVGEPQVVHVDPMSLAAMRLTHHLPFLVQDALQAAARCDHLRRQNRRATVDALTGLATRAEIGSRLGAAQPGDVVVLVDLDLFKQLNDTYGHEAGDDALRAFGQLLRRLVRGDDFCGRYGGDEFLLLLAQAPLLVARARMQQLAEAWAGEPAAGGTTLSVGIAPVGEAGAAEALRAADAAVYRAKRGGRNRVEQAEETSP